MLSFIYPIIGTVKEDFMINTNKLKGKMIEAGYTQLSLASAIGMSVNALNAKINGKATFNCDEADAVCGVST